MNSEEYRFAALGKMLVEQVVEQLQGIESNVLVVLCPKTVGPGFGGVILDHGSTGLLDLQGVVDLVSFVDAVQQLAVSIKVVDELGTCPGAMIFVSYIIAGPLLQILVHERLSIEERDPIETMQEVQEDDAASDMEISGVEQAKGEQR